jgi:hypothetical protein
MRVASLAISRRVIIGMRHNAIMVARGLPV